MRRRQAGRLPTAEKIHYRPVRLQPRSEDHTSILCDCLCECLTRCRRQTLAKTWVSSPPPELEPLTTLTSFSRSLWSFPFLFSQPPPGRRVWGQLQPPGLEGPATGSRKEGCEDEVRRSQSRTRWGRRYGAAVPANAQVRAASGRGRGKARLGEGRLPGYSVSIASVEAECRPGRSRGQLGVARMEGRAWVLRRWAGGCCDRGP